MKSVGEVMAIGRTFKEALQKAVRSLEIGRDGLGPLERDARGQYQGLGAGHHACTTCCASPTATASLPSTRRWRAGDSQATVCQITGFDPWFVAQIGEIVGLCAERVATLDAVHAAPGQAHGL